MQPLITEHPILVAIREKGVNSLKQDIKVFLQDDGKLKIDVVKLDRTGNSGVQNNHVVPVALFLASIKSNLERQTDLSTLFSNLSYSYGLDNINYDKFKIVLDYYQQRLLSGTITRSNIETIKVVLQDYIVPLIYDSWDSRAGAIFKERKSRSELGQEGSKIKKLKEQFTTLYNNNKKVENFDTFKEEIQNFIQEYNQNIDIPKNLSFQKLFEIMKDARSYLNILLDVINNSDKNSFLLSDSKTQLKPEVEQWYKEVLKMDEFGKKFINAHPKIIQKEQFLQELDAYSASSLSSDTRILTGESDDNTDLANSPIRNRGQKIEYDSNNIQQILLTSTGIKIGVILYTTTTAQRQNQQHIPGTGRLVEIINLYLAKQKEDPQHYLVIDRTSSSLVDTAYLANLHYSNKHQFWKLDIRPLVNYDQVEQQERVYLSNQLEDISTSIWGVKRHYDTNIKSVCFEQVVEYAKLRIKYFQLNHSNLQQYKSELSSITSSSPNSYIDQHYQESKINIQSLLMSPEHLSGNSDTEFIPLESIDLPIDSGIITRSKSHPDQDLNNPQPGPSGVQLQGQKRTNLDVGSQPSLKKACTGKSGSRSKRATDTCLFSWEDLDEISTRRTKNIDELQIDSKRFLEYLRNSNDQAKNSQLLELVKIRQIENSDNIVGNYKYLLDQVIQDGGYNSYSQNERIQDITHNLAENGFSGISTNLKNTIINAAGQIQLVRGTHGTIVACQTEGAERDCILSGLGLSYSFLSQPIEDIIVKQGSKFVIKVSKNFAQTVPRILGYNTKFVLKILSAKYGTVFLKGAAGGITGVFDIVDIALSAQALKECSDRADTDSKCSDREIRDNIASITFSGVSFVAGIVLTAASAGGPVTIGVALALMASYGIYSGVSAIVEYEEKYDTTDDENWRIFWHNLAFQSPPEDVQHLAARTEAINNIVKTAWQDLASMPANVVAYGGGLGKIRLEHFPKQCRTVLKYIQSVPGGGHVYVDECSPAYTKPYLESSSAVIDMRWSSNDNNYGLSRILPDHINGATMTCLPKATNAVYEKDGTIKSDSNAIYKCYNSFVIERDLRQNQGTKSIVFNSQLINSGRIIIGPDGLSGIFLLNSHNIDISTFSHRNEFIFLHNKFPGTIEILRHGSINTFNTGQLSDSIVTFNIEENWRNIYIRKINIFINGEQIQLLHDIDDSIQIQYHARKHKQDNIKCESRGNESNNSTNIFVDSGGGFNNQRQDIIKNCKKAIIWPYTKVEGNNGTYIFYIKTVGYEQQNSHSEINIIGKGTIIFLDTALLKDSEDITYSEASNTISLRIKLGENIFYRLELNNNQLKLVG